MRVETQSLEIDSEGRDRILDLTDRVREFLKGVKAAKGIVTVSARHSTVAVTTLEYEEGLLKDLPEVLAKIAPEGRYHHDETWGDGNGHAHLRSALIGTSRTFPVDGGEPVLGPWQQIVLCDFDNRPRRRTVDFTFVGA